MYVLASAQIVNINEVVSSAVTFVNVIRASLLSRN